MCSCIECIGDQREPTQDEIDAARYRWLRENISDDMQWYLLGTHGMGADDLDGAIDSAMLKTPNVELTGLRQQGASNDN